MAILATSGLFLLCLCSRSFGLDLIRRHVFGPDARNVGGKSAEIRWGFNETHFEILLAYPTKGWVAFGLSPNGAMAVSDVLFGYVNDPNGEVVIQDRQLKSSANRQIVSLTIDGSQDWSPVSGSQNASHTVIRAVRKIRTCDREDRTVPNIPAPVIYAMNPKDPASKTAPVQKHSERGSAWLNLLDDQPPSRPTDPIVRVLNFTMGNAKIGNSASRFSCRLIPMPTLSDKLQAVSYRAVIDKRSAEYIDGMAVFTCKGLPDELFVKDAFDCVNVNTGPMRYCDNLIGAYSEGDQVSGDLPDDTGLPFTPEMSGQYVLLKVHYNNPKAKAINADDSGFSFSLTNQERKNDIGYLVAGLMNWNYVLTIPAGQKRFRVTAQCSDQCTQSLPADGITVTGAMLGMHRRGISGMIRHFRGSTEVLPPIVNDDHFSSGFQSPDTLPVPRVILPGDRLVVECVYSTENDKQAITGGEDPSQETCLGILQYYPKVDLTMCGSYYSLPGLVLAAELPTKLLLDSGLPKGEEQTILQAMYPSGEGDDTMANLEKKVQKGIQDHLRTKAWTLEQVEQLQDFYASKKYAGLCGTESESDFKVVSGDAAPFIERFVEDDPYTC